MLSYITFQEARCCLILHFRNSIYLIVLQMYYRLVFFLMSTTLCSEVLYGMTRSLLETLL